jgi:hypothetical protein
MLTINDVLELADFYGLEINKNEPSSKIRENGTIRDLKIKNDIELLLNLSNKKTPRDINP